MSQLHKQIANSSGSWTFGQGIGSFCFSNPAYSLFFAQTKKCSALAEKYPFPLNFDGEGQKPDNRSLAYIVIGTLDKLNVFQSLQIFILMRKNKVCLSRKMKIKKKKSNYWWAKITSSYLSRKVEHPRCPRGYKQSWGAGLSHTFRVQSTGQRGKHLTRLGLTGKRARVELSLSLSTGSSAKRSVWWQFGSSNAAI